MSLALPMGRRESCPLLYIWFLLILALTYRLIFHHPFLLVNQTCLLCLSQIYTSSFGEQHIPQLWYLMRFITPTDTVSCISITFLLAVFASQCKSLIQYFLKTNNICRWKRFMLCQRHWKNKFKNIYNQSPLVDFFWNYPQCRGERRAQHQLIVN